MIVPLKPLLTWDFPASHVWLPEGTWIQQVWWAWFCLRMYGALWNQFPFDIAFLRACTSFRDTREDWGVWSCVLLAALSCDRNPCIHGCYSKHNMGWIIMGYYCFWFVLACPLVLISYRFDLLDTLCQLNFSIVPLRQTIAQVLQLLTDNEKAAANELAGRLFKTWRLDDFLAPGWWFLRRKFRVLPDWNTYWWDSAWSYRGR